MITTTNTASETYTAHYPLQWLDVLVSSFLIPIRGDYPDITTEKLEETLNNISQEEEKLQLLIKGTVFSFHSKRKIELSVRRYHSQLINLLNHCQENGNTTPVSNIAYSRLLEETISCIERLIAFIEGRFYQYLDTDEPCPAPYLELTQKEVLKTLEALKDNHDLSQSEKPVTNLLIKQLNRFARVTRKICRITIRDILYRKELLLRLQAISWNEDNGESFSPMDEVLIYMNYNSKQYIRLLTLWITEKLEACETTEQRLDKLLFYYKAFNQLQRNPVHILNPKYHRLDTVLSTWFREEINYYEKKISLSSLPNTAKIKVKKTAVQVSEKVLCMLSVDQTALILRAADETRLLKAKSMNQVFRTVVPYLSTPNREELSYGSLRSKSYHPEEKDKQQAIAALQKMIQKIKDY